MLLFLRETWELFWWAMFCPSRLQQRINEWSPQKAKYRRRPDTSFFEILCFGDLRFIRQYLFLLLIFDIPLIFKLIADNQLLDWLQFPCVILIAYGIAALFLPLGLVIPFLWLIVVLNQPDSWLNGLTKVIEIFLSLPQLYIGLGVVGLCLPLTVWLTSILLNKELLTLMIVPVGTIILMLGAWSATQNWLFVLLSSGIIYIVLLALRENIESVKQILTFGVLFGFLLGILGGGPVIGGVGVALIVSVILTFGVALIVSVILIFGVALIVSVIGVIVSVKVTLMVGIIMMVGATLKLPWFLVYTGLILFALAPAKKNWVFITTTTTLIALSAKNLGWFSAFVIPVTLVSYYRIIDYCLFANISFCISFLNRLFPPRLKKIDSLPPYTSELIWLPLPNHGQLLISEFSKNPRQALKIFQYTQNFSLPGFQVTLQNALPQIVSNQLQQIKSLPQLIFTANSNHPVLPFLISSFYHLNSDGNTHTPYTPLPKVKPELSILLPRLQSIVRDIQSALENKNIVLRERGLERIENNLGRLKDELPSLGLNKVAIKRWKPILDRWQNVIELEKNELRKSSQSELVNPFQYGNPVRLNQKDLFKGRQKFADEVVRRVLDRDRPTLVLHGPRRCGKSSFLYNLPRLFPSDILSVFLDMQSSAITNKESDFCYGLIRAIYKDCKIQGLQLLKIPERNEFQTSPYTTLEDWLDKALEQIGERRILINLDEFEKIGTAIQNGQISLRLFDQLRHLIQHYEQLGFLFCGVQTLEELGPNWSSYFISVVPIEMLYLEPDEAEELLLNPDPAFKLRYAPGIIEELLKLTNCHPYCLQLLGASMVNQANLNHTDLITSEVLQASINQAFTSGQPYFTNTWTEFTGINPEEIAIGQQFLLQIARTDNLNSINTPIEKKVLTRLLRYHILQKINGRYDFEVPLLKQWVRERAVKS